MSRKLPTKNRASRRIAGLSAQGGFQPPENCPQPRSLRSVARRAALKNRVQSSIARILAFLAFFNFFLYSIDKSC
jgi:hypothetical protein